MASTDQNYREVKKPCIQTNTLAQHLGSSEPSKYPFQHHEQHAHCPKVKAKSQNCYPRRKKITNVKCVITVLQHLANWETYSCLFVFTGIFMFYLFLNRSNWLFSCCILPHCYIPPGSGLGNKKYNWEEKEYLFSFLV